MQKQKNESTIYRILRFQLQHTSICSKEEQTGLNYELVFE